MWEAGGWESLFSGPAIHAFSKSDVQRLQGKGTGQEKLALAIEKDGSQSKNTAPTSLGSQSRKAALFEGHWETLKASKQEGPWLVSYCG